MLRVILITRKGSQSAKLSVAIRQQHLRQSPQGFENIQLEQMLAEMAVSYGVQVKFRNNDARSLRIYYTWSITMPLQKVLDELNRFKQFRVTLDGDTLIVE